MEIINIEKDLKKLKEIASEETLRELTYEDLESLKLKVENAIMKLQEEKERVLEELKKLSTCKDCISSYAKHN